MKKVLVTLLMIMVILSLGASYIFMGSGPTQVVQQPQPQIDDTFTPPTGAPSVNGPKLPAGAK